MSRRQLTRPAAWLALALALAVPAPPLLTVLHTLREPHVWCPVHKSFEHREPTPVTVLRAASASEQVVAPPKDAEPAHVACEHQLWLEQTFLTEVSRLEQSNPPLPTDVATPAWAPTRSSAWRLLEAPKLSPPLV